MFDDLTSGALLTLEKDSHPRVSQSSEIEHDSHVSTPCICKPIILELKPQPHLSGSQKLGHYLSAFITSGSGIRQLEATSMPQSWLKLPQLTNPKPTYFSVSPQGI